jgi:hypothetical protein
VTGAIAGVLAGAVIAGGLVACHEAARPADDKPAEILALWTQIRQWRHEARMDLDPTPNDLLGAAPRTIDDAKRVCPDNHPEPKACDDVCGLADAICDNAEAICNLTAKLGKPNAWAEDKCTSGKASCRESKQKCCGCSLPKDDK